MPQVANKGNTLSIIFILFSELFHIPAPLPKVTILQVSQKSRDILRLHLSPLASRQSSPRIYTYAHSNRAAALRPAFLLQVVAKSTASCMCTQTREREKARNRSFVLGTRSLSLLMRGRLSLSETCRPPLCAASSTAVSVDCLVNDFRPRSWKKLVTWMNG